jgi:hypothetical protein
MKNIQKLGPSMDGFANFRKNNMRFLSSRRFVFLPMLVFCLKMSAQTAADQKKAGEYAQLKERIETKHYRFRARSATTLKGKTISLTSDYFLQVKQDSLYVDLPYYGRSFSSSYSSTDPVLFFATGKFSYVSDTAKKGGWTIVIQPENNAGVSKITLEISTSAYCTVRVMSNTRDMISFYGTIGEYGLR